MKKLFSFFALNLLAPQDEYFDRQWYLQNAGFNIRRDLSEISSYVVLGKPGADIHFPFNFQLSSVPRKQVVVAILDTGIDIDHPEIRDSILKSSECDVLGHIPPKNSPDKDGNGFKGDCAGWNFASSTNADGDNQVYDDTGHGTHLAGLIAAKVDTFGIRGISDQIKILPVKIFNKYEIQNHPMRPKMKMMDRIQKGLEYAIHKNVDVINLSLGWPSVLDTPKLKELFALAANKNILIVAAAGNNAHHTTIYPCSYSGVICVGASTVDGSRAAFSNFGGNVDLMAPGENILSTIPKKIMSLYFDQDGFDFKNGTSQSAPLVAGGAALLKLALGELPVNELKARLLSSATKVSGDRSSLYGDMNLGLALANKPDQFLYLNLKELNAVEVSYPDGRFTFDVKLEKLMPGNVDGKITLNLDDVGAVLDQNEILFHFGLNEESRSVRFAGRVSDFNATSTQNISLVLDYGSHHHEFRKELTFALDAERVSKRIAIGEKINGNSLRSVDNSLRLSDQTLFYTLDAAEKEQTISILEWVGDSLQKKIEIRKKSELKLVAVALTGARRLVVETYDQKEKKLYYDFWDSGSYQPVKTLEMVPDTAVFGLTQSSYFSEDGTKGKLRAVTLTTGKIPPSERNKSVFLSQQNASGDHLYYFEEQDGKITTGLLDNETFRKELMHRYHLRFDDGIFPIALLGKGIGSTLDSLVVIGKGYYRKVLLVRFSGHHEFQILREYLLPGGAALKEVTFLGKSMLAVQERKDAYQLFDLETGEFTTYSWGDRFDDLLGPIVKLSKDLLLAQTQNHFVVLGKDEHPSLPLKRFSFLPGELFSEMFSPVNIVSGQDALPGLFIDGTMISDQHLGVVSWNGERIVKTIYFQEKLPRYCRVMNPQPVRGVDQMILFCSPDSETQYLLSRSLIASRDMQ